MRIAEIYSSKQGEGLLCGTPSVFVRASGCNLRCRFCDTPFTSWEPEGEDRSIEEIAEIVRGYSLSHVVITGGEPMLFAELIPLSEILATGRHHLTIETAGTLFLPTRCDLMSISPKLSNSAPDAHRFPQWHSRHERTRRSIPIVRRLLDLSAYQLKFVVESVADCDEVDEYLTGIPEVNRDRVLLMPQGVDPGELARAESWLLPLCEKRGLRFCPRRHIEWYGHRRGT